MLARQLFKMVLIVSIVYIRCKLLCVCVVVAVVVVTRCVLSVHRLKVRELF